MELVYKSRLGLEVWTVQGEKSARDRIIEIRKESFRHRITIAEMAAIIGRKALNEETEYPRELGFKGHKKLMAFINEYVKRYLEDPNQDLDALIKYLERKHGIVQMGLGLTWIRKRVKTG
jgi:hypothetical protein